MNKGTTQKVCSLSKRLSRCRGMSLIEMMIVIGIVAVLAAILTAVAQPALRKARSAKCLSNLKQIGALMLQYANEHNGALATPGNSSDTNLAASWTTALGDYSVALKSDVLICPSDPDPNKKANGYSYAMNGLLDQGFDTGNKVYQPLRLTSVRKPSQIIFFADSIASKNGRSVGVSTVQYLHDAKFNAVFLDGHCATLRSQDSTNTIWNPALQ